MTTKDRFAHLALEGKTIDANVKRIKATGKTFYALVHRTAVAIVVQSLPHSEGGHLDCSKAAALIAALPGASRANALKAWFEHYSNIRFNGDNKVGLLKPADKDYNPSVNPIEANGTPYWELTPEPAVAGPLTDVDLDRMLQGIIKRIATAKDEGRLALSPATVNSLGAVEKMAETLHRRAEAEKARAKAETDAAKAKAAPARPKVTPNPNPVRRRADAVVARDNAKDAQQMAAHA